MNYTLITPTGKVYTFFIKSVAETYQSAYGGTLIDNRVLSGVQQLDVVL
jgi:hypothetical protein